MSLSKGLGGYVAVKSAAQKSKRGMLVPNEVFESDPLLKFMVSKFRTPLRAAIWVGIINAIVYFGAGLFINHTYLQKTFMPIFHPAELSLGVFIWFIFLPVLWAYYMWQPRATFKVIQSLRSNSVIPCANNIPQPKAAISETADSNVSHNDLGSMMTLVLSKSRWSAIAFLITLAVMASYVISLVPTEFASMQGIPTFWFVDRRTHSLLFALVFLNGYIFSSFLIRTIVTVWEFHTFFRVNKFVITVHPFHPDQCGGLASLGSFSVRIGLLAVVVGAWAVFFTFRPMLCGGYPVLDFSTISLFVLYIILAPTFLLAPVWSAHKAMEHFRDSKLSEISIELEELVISSLARLSAARLSKDAKVLQTDLEKMKYLQDMYQFIRKTTPTWPISVPTFKKFSITASLPLVLGVLSFIIDIVQRIGAG